VERYRELLLSVLLFVGICLFSGAQGRGQDISLKEALERALLGNREIRKAEIEVEIARSALRKARENTFSPAIAVGETIRLSGESPEGFSLELQDTISFDASLWEEEKVSLERAERALEATKEEVKKNVVTSYLEILKTKNTLALEEKSLELLKGRLERLREGYEKGEAAAFALQEAEGRYREQEGKVRVLKEKLRLLEERFFQLLGEEIPGEEVTFQPLPQRLPAFSRDLTLQDFVAMRDEVEDLEGQRRVLEAQEAQLRRKGLPQITLEGTYSKDGWSLTAGYSFSAKSLNIALEKPLGTQGVSSGEHFGVGLAVSWSFSPSLSEEKKQVELRKKALLLDLETEKATILFDIREKYLSLCEARDTLEGKRMLLEAERERHAQVMKQWELGSIDQVTLLESELSLFQAQVACENAFCDLLASFVAFLRSTEQPILWETLFPQEGDERT